jgi:hypothetical protein
MNPKEIVCGRRRKPHFGRLFGVYKLTHNKGVVLSFGRDMVNGWGMEST